MAQSSPGCVAKLACLISGDQRRGPARVGRGPQGQRPTLVPGQRRRRRRLDLSTALFGNADVDAAVLRRLMCDIPLPGDLRQWLGFGHSGATFPWGVGLGRLGLALVVLSVVEQRLDAVRAVLDGADVVGVAARIGAPVNGAPVGGAVSDRAAGRAG